jgi:5-methylcytosine-specific restriction endonuclease McrA
MCATAEMGPAAPPVQRPAPDAVEPLTADLSRLHVTVPRRLLAKLEAARAALSHSHPAAGMAEILEAGLDLVLDRHAKRNGLVKRPRKSPRPSSDPDRIPAHVRRAVWTRDGGKCQSPVASGGICGSTVRVDLHHVTSRARGGPPTLENLVTVCDLHHDLETRREFGDALVDRCVRSKRGRARSRTLPSDEAGGGSAPGALEVAPPR